MIFAGNVAGFGNSRGAARFASEADDVVIGTVKTITFIGASNTDSEAVLYYNHLRM